MFDCNAFFPFALSLSPSLDLSAWLLSRCLCELEQPLIIRRLFVPPEKHTAAWYRFSGPIEHRDRAKDKQTYRPLLVSFCQNNEDIETNNARSSIQIAHFPNSMATIQVFGHDLLFDGADF